MDAPQVLALFHFNYDVGDDHEAGESQGSDVHLCSKRAYIALYRSILDSIVIQFVWELDDVKRGTSGHS